jgi:hypothetical protein
MKKFLRIAELKDFRLPDGRYGFGRIYADACVAFHKQHRTELVRQTYG